MAFRTQKISQMTPKGANLEATDLIEVSTIESGSYVTRSITGQEIIDAAVGNVDWGDIGGTLSAQTDLQNALDAKQDDITLTTTGSSGASTLVGATLNVPNYTLSGLGGVPTSRTLTINGVTQDLSANRTFTISTGITIGSTAIASGVVGRVLFEGAGNVVQESSSLFWDNTNVRLGVGTSTPITAVEVKKTGSDSWITASRGTNTFHAGFLFNPSGSWTASNVLWNFGLYANTNDLRYWTYNGSIDTNVLNLFGSTANVGIGTTTDAGFRLDVNGTARVQGGLTVANTGNYAISASKGATTGLGSQYFNNGGTLYWGVNDSSGSFLLGTNGLAYSAFFTSTTSALQLGTNATARLTIFPTTGNVAINTTTDAGFRLDVNGTARVKATSTTGEIFTTQTSTGLEALVVYADRSSYIYGSNVSGYTTNIRIGGQANMANINFFGNNNIYVGQGGSTENIPSALIAMGSTNKGFLPPRMTTTQKNAIASPAAGLMVYDTTLNVISYYNGSMWI